MNVNLISTIYCVGVIHNALWCKGSDIMRIKLFFAYFFCQRAIKIHYFSLSPSFF